MEENAIFKKNFARKLKELRISWGMTQEKFAEKIDVSYATYVKVERNKRTPSIQFVRHLKEYTGISADYFLSDNYDELEMVWLLVNNMSEFNQAIILKRLADKIGKPRCKELLEIYEEEAN